MAKGLTEGKKSSASQDEMQISRRNKLSSLTTPNAIMVIIMRGFQIQGLIAAQWSNYRAQFCVSYIIPKVVGLSV